MKLIKKMFYAGIGAVEFSREQIRTLRERAGETLDDFVERGERLTEHEDSLAKALMAALRPKKRVPSLDEVEVLIPGYSEMTVTQIIDQLKRMSMKELEIVRDYEHHNLNRVRIVRQIERELDEARILPGYDELPVGAIVRRLDGLSEQDLAALREYEKSHRNRVTILKAIDRRLAEAA